MMNKAYDVKNVRLPSDEEGFDCYNFDGLVYVIGYEKRSSFIAKKRLCDQSFVLGIIYTNSRILSFAENLKYAEESGFKTVADTTPDLETAISEHFQKIRTTRSAVRIAVDVSAMDRAVMSTTILTILDLLSPEDEILLLYTPARFQKPSLDLLPIRAFGPAHPKLSGCVGDPNWGRALVLGLGYDYGVSLSILDSHEADINFIFSPFGLNKQYDDEVEKANFDFDFGERVYWLRKYDIKDISSLYTVLNNIVYPMIHNNSVIIAPMGPKIFSAVCILVASIYQSQVSVLRYSLEKEGRQRDVEPDSVIVGCSARLISNDSLKRQRERGLI